MTINGYYYSNSHYVFTVYLRIVNLLGCKLIKVTPVQLLPGHSIKRVSSLEY